MVALDVAYARSWSPLLELQILLKTPKAVLSARGAA
jgi:lipopolysaccharide/colanic/teichoic acid biosynthesis glycosyltransferase